MPLLQKLEAIMELNEYRSANFIPRILKKAGMSWSHAQRKLLDVC